MKLSNTSIKYFNGTDFVEIANLISCDVTKSATATRSNWDREGTVINETFNSIVVNFKRGSNTVLDNAKTKDVIKLQWDNGGLVYSADFSIAQKFNTKKDTYTNTYISFALPENSAVEIEGKGGSGGGVTKAYVDEQDAKRVLCAGDKKYKMGLDSDGDVFVEEI